jgi:hypothetical protein
VHAVSAPWGEHATLAELMAENARFHKQRKRAELERDIKKEQRRGRQHLQPSSGQETDPYQPRLHAGAL